MNLMNGMEIVVVRIGGAYNYQRLGGVVIINDF